MRGGGKVEFFSLRRGGGEGLADGRGEKGGLLVANSLLEVF